MKYDGSLPETSKVGINVKIVSPKLHFGQNVVIGDNVTLAGDEINIGDNVIIGSGTDMRSANLRIGEGCDIGNNVKVLVADEFIIGSASRISANASITCRRFTAKNFLYLAQEFSVGYGGTYESTSIVEFGENVALGPHNIINANHKIILKDNVGSGSYVTIWTHGFHFGHSVLDGFPLAHEGVTVEENVWLGYHVTVLPSITIGQNTIVAACSVVAKSLPANCLAAGSPAQFKKTLESRPIGREATFEFLVKMLDNWLIELEWKGISSEPIEPGYIKVNYLSGTTSVLIVDSAIKAKWEENQRIIFITYDETISIQALSENSNATLFDIKNKKIYGLRNSLIEDLRDFLRRHTLSCANDRVFTSIEPIAFSRLRSMV